MLQVIHPRLTSSHIKEEQPFNLELLVTVETWSDLDIQVGYERVSKDTGQEPSRMIRLLFFFSMIF